MIIAAPFSPIIIVGAFVFPDVIYGMLYSSEKMTLLFFYEAIVS